jgi:kynurenine formamidase
MKLPSRMLDISVALDNDTIPDPPFMRPKIDYKTGKENAWTLLEAFPGLKSEDLPDGEAWSIEFITLATHNGTHMDAPYHFQSKSIRGEYMMTIDEVPLDWFFRPGVKLDFRKLPDGHVVSAAEVEAELKRIGHALQPFDIVLVNTRASECIGTEEYLTAGCGMGREATLYLTSRSLHHLGGPQGRPRDPLLPHGEAVQSRAAAGRRFHRRLLPVQDQSRLRRLDPRSGTI